LWIPKATGLESYERTRLPFKWRREGGSRGATKTLGIVMEIGNASRGVALEEEEQSC